MITPERARQLRDEASKTADKYIKDGKRPAARSVITQDQTRHLVNVSSFIIHQPDGVMWGGVKKREAVASLASLLKLKEHDLIRAITKPSR
jgi:hypothetical protein